MKFKSIQEQGGLAAYLDLPEEKAKHKGRGYSEWRQYRDDLKLNKSQLADAFNVTRNTIDSWIKLEAVQ